MMSKNSIVPFLKDYLIKFLTRPFLLDTNDIYYYIDAGCCESTRRFVCLMGFMKPLSDKWAINIVACYSGQKYPCTISYKIYPVSTSVVCTV